MNIQSWWPIQCSPQRNVLLDIKMTCGLYVILETMSQSVTSNNVKKVTLLDHIPWYLFTMVHTAMYHSPQTAVNTSSIVDNFQNLSLKVKISTVKLWDVGINCQHPIQSTKDKANTLCLQSCPPSKLNLKPRYLTTKDHYRWP